MSVRDWVCDVNAPVQMVAALRGAGYGAALNLSTYLPYGIRKTSDVDPVRHLLVLRPKDHKKPHDIDYEHAVCPMNMNGDHEGPGGTGRALSDQSSGYGALPQTRRTRLFWRVVPGEANFVCTDGLDDSGASSSSCLMTGGPQLLRLRFRQQLVRAMMATPPTSTRLKADERRPRRHDLSVTFGGEELSSMRSTGAWSLRQLRQLMSAKGPTNGTEKHRHVVAPSSGAAHLTIASMQVNLPGGPELSPLALRRSTASASAAGEELSEDMWAPSASLRPRYHGRSQGAPGVIESS